MALILALAILGGFERELTASTVRFTAHIEARGFHNILLENTDSIVQRIRSHPNIRAVSAYIEVEGLARSPTFVDGVIIRGITPEHDVGNITSTIQQGKGAFSSPQASEVIIGTKLAHKLGLTCGQKLVLYSSRHATAPSVATNNKYSSLLSVSDASHQAVIEQCRIIGLYETGMSSLDELYVYIPFERAATIFGIPKHTASGFDILVRDISQVHISSTELEKLLGYPFFLQTLYEKYNDIFAWIDLQKQPVPLVIGLITVVAVCNVVTTLFMTVVQKMSSIGVLRAIGMQRQAIARIFLFQGVLLSTGASIIGCSIAFLLCFIQAEYRVVRLHDSIYFLSAVPIEFAWHHYALVIGISVAISALASSIPAV
ncbi:MAG: FtsX-like permease family protein, partial [Candidatus Kapabacteria bacterium]|nr:FtsX-like permease family protein [Candidatus Kapabacteria bacterium]